MITAQVGINTTSPNGILDVNSSTSGIVLPRIALISTVVELPVLNPNGGSLAVGTVVYNTSSTSLGSDDVFPGIYVWNGSEWINKFTKKDAEFFTQSSDVRTRSNAGFQNITGLVAQSFTAKYSGTYKIEISVNYGGGQVDNNSTGVDSLAQEGEFKFTFDGTDHFIPASCYSVQGSTNYYLIWEQSSIILYETFTAGNSYNFSLQFDQFDSTGFENSGNSGDGMGYIGYDIPCSVEFIFLNE